MKLLKKVGAALVSLAMLAGTAFTTIAAAEDTEGYYVSVIKTDMDSQEYFVLSVQNVPVEWVNNSISLMEVQFGDVDTKKWAEAYLDFMSMITDERVYSSRIVLDNETQEEAITSYFTKTDDNVYGVEIWFPANSKGMAEFTEYDWVNIYLGAVVNDGDDLKQIYYTNQQKGVDSPVSIIVSVSWLDWTVPADTSDLTEETPKPTEEPAEPTEEPTEPTEEPTEPTEEPIESAEPEPTEEPAETEAPEDLETIVIEEPETEVPETPAEPAPAESAPVANTAENKGNPDTGAAVAVIPLLIAGAGTAVLTRKRK